MQLLTLQKKILGPVHLLPKPDKWDYLQSPIIDFFSFLVLTSGKFLKALGSRIGTFSIFCHSFSLWINVCCGGIPATYKFIRGMSQNWIYTQK